MTHKRAVASIYDKLAATGNLIANMDATGGLLNSLSDDV